MLTMAGFASPQRRLSYPIRKAPAEYLEEVGACDDPEDPQVGVRVLWTGGDLLRGRVLGDRVVAARETPLDRLVDRLGHERRRPEHAKVAGEHRADELPLAEHPVEPAFRIHDRKRRQTGLNDLGHRLSHCVVGFQQRHLADNGPNQLVRRHTRSLPTHRLERVAGRDGHREPSLEPVRPAAFPTTGSTRGRSPNCSVRAPGEACRAPPSLLPSWQGSSDMLTAAFHATRHSDRRAPRSLARCSYRLLATATSVERGVSQCARYGSWIGLTRDAWSSSEAGVCSAETSRSLLAQRRHASAGARGPLRIERSRRSGWAN